MNQQTEQHSSEQQTVAKQMNRIMISEVSHLQRNQVKLCGWVHRIRKLKHVTFLILRDRTGLIQCVLEQDIETDVSLNPETVVCLTGLVVEGKNAYGLYEIQVNHLEVLNTSETLLPIQVNLDSVDVQLDTLLEHRVLGLRHPKEKAIFVIQSRIAQYFAAFLIGEGFMEIHTPKLVKEGAEGGANVFKLDYFGETAYLAQSPQFYKQMTVIAGFERVFEIGSVFRAETHSTSRHLNEYVSLDFEMAFIKDEYELMTMETALLSYIMHALETSEKAELERLDITLPIVPPQIPHMKLSEAIEILKTVYGKTELDGDLDPEGEKLICEHIFKETGSEFLFLTHYPQRKRPMYTMPCGTDETHSFDLLFRGLEITTGGCRIHRYEALLENMKKKGLNPDAYSSYLEAFKYGAPPHGGLAIGLERLTAQLLGFSNVRRTSLFPRDGLRLVP